MRFVFAGLMCMALCSTGLAETTIPHTFTAGTPALASEVNANFHTLVTAINALEGRIDKLEGQIAFADIVGTYAIAGLQTGLHAVTNIGGIEVISWTGTITFAGDGTFAAVFGNDKHSLQWSVLNPNPAFSAGLGSQITDDSSAEINAGTWDLVGGAVSLTLLDPNSSPAQFHAVSGGRLLVGSAHNNLDATNVLLLFSKLD